MFKSKVNYRKVLDGIYASEEKYPNGVPQFRIEGRKYNKVGHKQYYEVYAFCCTREDYFLWIPDKDCMGFIRENSVFTSLGAAKRATATKTGKASGPKYRGYGDKIYA